MSTQAWTQIAAALGAALFASTLAWRLKLGLGTGILRAAARATVQLAVVGLLIAGIYRAPALAAVFVGAMLTAAALTAGGRLKEISGSRRRAGLAIGAPALTATGLLLLVGAFEPTPQAVIPTAGILIGGAMTATTLTGRRLLEGLRGDLPAIEARLSLGDDVRTAVAPLVRQAVTTGLIPAIDQTRSVGLVALPGTFVGLVLGGASPETAARLQLVVLLTLLAVQLVAGLVIAEAIVRRASVPGAERIELPLPSHPG